MGKYIVLCLAIVLGFQGLPAQFSRARKACRLIEAKGCEPTSIVKVLGIPSLVVEAKLDGITPAIGFFYAEGDRKKKRDFRKVTNSWEEIETFLRWYSAQDSFVKAEDVPQEKLREMGWGDAVYLFDNGVPLVAVSGMTHFIWIAEEVDEEEAGQRSR